MALDMSTKAMDARHRLLWQSLAVVVRIAFHALLRPGEALGLTRGDVTFVTPVLRERTAVLAIRRPKTRHVMGAGRSQFATVRDVSTVAWLEAFCGVLKMSDFVWPASRSTFNTMFKLVVKSAGLESCRITPASMRSGGATAEMLSGTSMEAIAFHGRWVSIASLRSYLQEGASHLIWNHLSASARARCEALLIRYHRILLGPPLGWPR